MASFMPVATEHYPPQNPYYDVKPSFYEPNAVSVIQQQYSIPHQLIQPQPVYHPQQQFFEHCGVPSFYYYPQTASASIPQVQVQVPPSSNANDELRAESEDSVVHGGGGGNTKKPRNTHAKRGRPTKNPVWTLFQRIDEKSVLCSMCGRVVKSACATNMTKHIERHHQDVEDLREAHQPQPTVLSYTGDEYAGWNTNTERRVPAKRHRRTKHPVWELFCRAEDGTARCVLCQATVRSPCSSNFMGHLNRHHMDHYQNIYQRWIDNRSMDA